MAAHIGVIATDISTPTGSYANESSKSSSVTSATVQDESGNFVVASTTKTEEITHTLSGKGDADLSSVVAGTDFVDGTAVITSARVTENAEDFPDFEITAKEYKSLPASP